MSDFSRSQAILIGTADYQDPGFQPLPAAGNSITSMQQVLTDPGLCGWPPERVTVLQNPADARRVVQTLRQLARSTNEVLLIYFVGHGVLLPRARLCLVLSDTVPEDPDVTGLEYDRVREALLDSPARTKIVILDCCYSGRAIEALSGEDGIADCTDTAGTYTLTASDSAAHVVALEQQADLPTSFTGELLDLIRCGIHGAPEWLTLDLIYGHLCNRLRSRGLPAPNQRGIGTASQFPFTRNYAGELPATPLLETREPVGKSGGWGDGGARSSSRGSLLTAQRSDPDSTARPRQAPSPIARGRRGMGIIIALTIVLGAIGAGVAVWLNAGPSPIAVDTCARGAGGPAVPRKIEDLLTGGKKKDFVGVAFSSDCRILATAGDGTVQVWNMVSAQRIATLAAAPDSVTLGMSFAPNGETLAVAAADGPTTLWNIATGQLITSLPSDPNGTYAVAFNRDGTELFTGGSTGVVDIWDVSTHQLIHKISTGDAVGDLALSPNGKLLAVGGDDGNNRLYDAATGAQFKTLRGGEMHVFTMVFSPDGTILATGTRDGVVQWWDVTTHQLIASTRSFGSVTDLAFSPDGKFLAAGGEGTVQLLDTSTHELAARLSVGSADWPQGLAFNRYGGILAVGWEGTLQLWNVAGITHAPG